MVRRWLLAAILASAAVRAGARADQPAPGPRWLTDLNEARREAREAGKPIFAVFRCEH
jgi:hypothetical protein